MTKPDDSTHVMNYAVEGLMKEVRSILQEQIIKQMVEEFEAEITEIVSDKVAQLFFDASSYLNPAECRHDIQVLIKWAKLEKEKKFKYSIQQELVDD